MLWQRKHKEDKYGKLIQGLERIEKSLKSVQSELQILDQTLKLNNKMTEDTISMLQQAIKCTQGDENLSVDCR